MKAITALLTSVLVAGVFGCTRHQDNHHDDHGSHAVQSEAAPMEHSDHPEVQTSQKALSDEQQAEVLEVFEVNERLHAAFFEYDEQKVESEAKNMINAIENISNSEVAERLQYSKEILAKISASADRDDNNQNYHLASMALIHILTNYDIGSEFKGYSCPMVKMQWVQNTSKLEKVHNPYAPEMPHCGEMHN